MLKAYNGAALHLRLLKGVFNDVIFPYHNLPLLLGSCMLDPHFLCLLDGEFADEARIPQLRCDAQVFAAPHEGIGFAALCRRRYSIGVEILLFATGYGNQPRESGVSSAGGK